MTTGYSSADWADTLATLPLFEGLSRRHVRTIAKMGKIQRWEPRAAIVKRGAEGDAFYLIVDGSAAVRRPGKKPVILGEGDSFGELALLANAPRAATVEAVDRCTTVRIGRKDFATIIKTEPKVAQALLHNVASMLSEVLRTEV